MPKYHLPNGKSFFTEKELSPEDLEGAISELMDNPDVPEITPADFSNVESGKSSTAAKHLSPLDRVVQGLPQETQEEPAFFESMEGKSPIQALSDPTTLAFRRRSEKDTKEHFAPMRQDTDNVNKARFLGLLEGANEGAGEVLTSMSAPVDLAAQLTGVKGLSQAARFARLTGKVGSAGTAVRGASNTFGADKTIGERASGVAEMILGLLGTGKVPDANVVGKPKQAPITESTYAGDTIDTIEAPLEKSAYTGDETIVNKASEDFNPRPPEPELEATIRTNDTQTKRAKEIILKHHGPEQAAEIFRVKPEVELMDYAKTLIPEKSVANGIPASEKVKVKVNLDGSFTEKETGVTVDNLKDLIKAPVKPATPYGNDPINDPIAITNNQGQTAPPLSNKYTGKPAEVINNQGVVPVKVKVVKGELVDKYSGKPVDFTNNQGKIQVDDVDKIPPSKGVKIPAPKLVDELGNKIPEEHKIIQGMNVFRALQTSVDMSFPFRQGLGQILTKGWWNSWKGMVQSYGSEAAYKGVTKAVMDHPDFKFAQEQGLALPDLSGHIEEMHRSNVAERMWGIGRAVKASGRAYNAFALKMRMDNFAAQIKGAEKIYQTAKKTGSARPGLWEQKFTPDSAEMLNPRTNLVLAKQLAEMINVTSGRGNLGRLEKVVGELNTLIYSPRFVKSRLDMLNPMRYKFLNSQAQLEYAKSAVSMAGFWLSTAAILKQFPGVTVIDDPDSADFGKIQIGDTRFDPPAGLQQYIVLMHRIGSGEKTSTTGARETEKMGTGWQGYPGAIADFGKNKLAPVPSILSKYAFRSNGRPFEVGEELLSLMTPMTVNTLSSLIQDDPWLFPGIIPAAVGVGTQTYDEEGNSPRLFGSYFPKEKDISLTGGGWFK